MSHDREHPRNLYTAVVLDQVPRLLGQLDRDPHSPTFGLFDREFWAWKFRDFPITMLQAAMLPLARLWHHPLPGNVYHRNDALRDWILGAMRRLMAMQRSNGAFDSVAPFTQDHGVTLVAAAILAETAELLDDGLADSDRDRVHASVRAAAEFGLRSHEDYAFISNHQAAIALAFHRAGELLDEARYHDAARNTIDLILAHQSPDGWYEEYGGPDPGYESLGIAYLATLWIRTREDRLLDSLRRALDFYSHCVHPDGSVGGGYGTRQTSLFFPSGFESLAAALPVAAGVARFMRRHIPAANVVTPASADPENLAILAADYLAAAIAVRPHETPPPPLPCESLRGSVYFADAAWAVAGTQHYYALVAAGRGGPCRVHARQDGRIAYQDAGYLVRARGELWTSQTVGGARVEGDGSGSEVACRSAGVRVRQEVPTPGKFVVLRLLNLTLFRNVGLGRWLRRRIIRRLTTARQAGPYRLERRVVFGDEAVEFRDRLSGPRGRVDGVWLPRAFTGVHMGSAKYFQSSEIVRAAGPVTDGLAEALRGGAAELSFAVRFGEDVSVERLEAVPEETVVTKENR